LSSIILSIRFKSITNSPCRGIDPPSPAPHLEAEGIVLIRQIDIFLIVQYFLEKQSPRVGENYRVEKAIRVIHQTSIDCTSFF
jgi:hypothetical protein